MEERRLESGKIWAAIEEARRDNAVLKEAFDSHEKYVHQRFHDLINQVAKTDTRVELLAKEIKDSAYRRDTKMDDLAANIEKQMLAEEKRDKAFLTRGLWTLGGIVTLLIGYIWRNQVGGP